MDSLKENLDSALCICGNRITRDNVLNHCDCVVEHEMRQDTVRAALGGTIQGLRNKLAKLSSDYITGILPCESGTHERCPAAKETVRMHEIIKEPPVDMDSRCKKLEEEIASLKAQIKEDATCVWSYEENKMLFTINQSGIYVKGKKVEDNYAVYVGFVEWLNACRADKGLNLIDL